MRRRSGGAGTGHNIVTCKPDFVNAWPRAMHKKIELDPLIRALESRGVMLKKQGARFTGPCPVHHGERHNFSLFLNRDGKWQAHCFSKCCRSWSPAALLCAIDGTEPQGTSWRMAMDELGVPLDSTAPTRTPPKTWPQGFPLPSRATLTEAVGTWIGFTAGAFSLESPADPAEAEPPDPDRHLVVVPEFDDRLKPLTLPAKLAVVRFLQRMVGAPELATLVASDEGEIHAWFLRSTPGRDHAFYKKACEAGANPRFWQCEVLGLQPGTEVPHAVTLYWNGGAE